MSYILFIKLTLSHSVLRRQKRNSRGGHGRPALASGQSCTLCLRRQDLEVTLSTAWTDPTPWLRAEQGCPAPRPHHPAAFLSPLSSTDPAGAMGVPSPVPATPPSQLLTTAHLQHHQSRAVELCAPPARRQCVAGRVLAPQLKKPSLCQERA